MCLKENSHVQRKVVHCTFGCMVLKTYESKNHLSCCLRFEMMKRGFIAVQAGYDAGSAFEYINSPGT